MWKMDGGVLAHQLEMLSINVVQLMCESAGSTQLYARLLIVLFVVVFIIILILLCCEAFKKLLVLLPPPPFVCMCVCVCAFCGKHIF
jgi:hypothetical protein